MGREEKREREGDGGRGRGVEGRWQRGKIGSSSAQRNRREMGRRGVGKRR